VALTEPIGGVARMRWNRMRNDEVSRREHSPRAIAVAAGLTDRLERPIASRLIGWGGAALAEIYLTKLYNRAASVALRGLTDCVSVLAERCRCGGPANFTRLTSLESGARRGCEGKLSTSAPARNRLVRTR
jgi:hypothetical protein